MPFGDTDVTPYTERLFLGGFNTVRGFEFRGVGPNSEQFQLVEGGESMLRASVEYRYPTRPERDQIQRFLYDDDNMRNPTHYHIELPPFDDETDRVGYYDYSCHE